jgi:hypothetical protein
VSAPPILITCEGSGYVGHPIWGGDTFGAAVMCQMCGQTFPPADTFDQVPDHTRPDLIAMIDRGDFNP